MSVLWESSIRGSLFGFRKVWRCLSVYTTKYRSVSVSEELIRASVHGHAFATLHICPDNRHVCILGVQHKGFIIRWMQLKCPLSGFFWGFLDAMVYAWVECI